MEGGLRGRAAHAKFRLDLGNRVVQKVLERFVAVPAEPRLILVESWCGPRRESVVPVSNGDGDHRRCAPVGRLGYAERVFRRIDYVDDR